MLFKSALLTQASGSIGGMTASHNAGGMYFRSRSVPTNPNTPGQQTVRNAFAAATQRWSNVLTQEQRDEWNAYAANVPVFNNLGDQVHRSGFNWYVGSASLRLQAGEAIVDDGPTVMTLIDIGTISMTSISAASGEIRIEVGDSPAWAADDDDRCLIYVSSQQSPGKKFFKGPFQFHSVVNGDSAAPVDSLSPVVSGLLEGNQLFVRLRVVGVDGRRSSDTIVSGLIGA